MQELSITEPLAGQIDARIILESWSRSYECKVAFVDSYRVCVTTKLARDLPDRFDLCAAPDFVPRPCLVMWRGKCQVEVELFG